MTNTNLLTDPSIAASFLAEGALIQTSTDDFKVFIGPFQPLLTLDGHLKDDLYLLYSLDFWSFLNPQKPLAEYFLPRMSFKATRGQLQDFLSLIASKVSNQHDIQWRLPHPSDFQKQFDWIQRQIIHGDLDKALPIALQHGQGIISTRLKNILGRIINHSTVNYGYGFWTANSGLIGMTPEVLCSWTMKEAALKTMALAGTWKKNSPNDFSDSKIHQEHNFVIQDIQTQLSAYALNYKSETELVELPYLFHLKTQFQYQCPSLETYLEAVRLLHPTAALGLFPRSRQVMFDFAQFDLQQKRTKFGAPIGFVNVREAFALVGIRNIMWKNDQIDLFAGCGVTKNSVFDDEWTEILAKQDSVKKMLGIEN